MMLLLLCCGCCWLRKKKENKKTHGVGCNHMLTSNEKMRPSSRQQEDNLLQCVGKDQQENKDSECVLTGSHSTPFNLGAMWPE